MENDQKASLIALGVLALSAVLAIGGMIAYDSRYELGLVKPKFKVGECIQKDLSDEFNKHYINYLVMKVGKKEYLALWYNAKGNALNDDGTALRIKYTDGDYQKTTCPEHIYTY